MSTSIPIAPPTDEPKQVNSTVSYSRLSCYSKCARQYWHKYINHTYAQSPVEEALIKGSLTHELIERHLVDGISINEALKLRIRDWVTDNCNLPTAEEHPEGISIQKLEASARDMGKLLQKCSAAYTGLDSIRNRDGSVPKSPLKYPPGELTRLMNAMGLQESRMELDNAAAALNANFERFSFANTAAIAMSFAYNFHLPEWIDEVVAVEYDLESQPIEFEGKRVTGRADYVVRSINRDKIILDGKSSARAPAEVDIYYHGQLNMYVMFEFEHSGEFSDYIGIYHMPTGRYLIAKVSLDVAQEIYGHYSGMQRHINSCGTDPEAFHKKLPSDYNTPCIRWAWDVENKVDQVCPYIRHCWPGYARQIEPQLLNHIGKAPTAD